ncbi:MAG: glycosyltransferase family 2 protein [Acidimicrobiia bacterium]|nr:glycosyltransferase family 2 protein [Acidimicrobiia bacterium]
MSAASPRCSIVIPVFNRADQIGDSLDSVWAQSFGDFEVVLVDDGSTDDLEAALANHTDDRLRVVRQENAGPAAARNLGMSEARGELIAYLDSDDRWLPNHLEATIAELDRCNSAAVYSPMIVDRGVGRYAVRPSRGMRDGESFGDYRFVHAELLLVSTLVHRTELRDQIAWDERLFYGDVDQYLLDLVRVTGPIPMLPYPTALYNDITGPEKLSQVSVYGRDSQRFRNFLAWLDEQDALSPQAVAAHRARNLSGVQERRLDTVRLLAEAYHAGAMTMSGATREYIRARNPRAYRYLIDTYVYLRGKPLEELIEVQAHDQSRDRCQICANTTTHGVRS